MGWKATGQPTVRKQRDKWAVRLNGIDTETGRHRPRQLGTYASQWSARTAADGIAADGIEGGGKGTVGWLVDRWVAAKTRHHREEPDAEPLGGRAHPPGAGRHPPRPTRP